MMIKKEVYTLALLPWLKLGEDLELGTYRFLRWPRDDSEIAVEFRESINSICNMYKYISGETEQPQTIMIDTSKALFCRSDEKERQQYVEAVTLLTMALIGENQYFHHGNYVNSSMTEIHFQNFSLGEDWVAFTSRKRDGNSTDMGYTFDKVIISTPTACRIHTGCNSISGEWLKSLETVLSKSTPLDRLIIEASSLFTQANTDSPSVMISTEVITLANAFERLLEAERRLKISEKLSSVLSPWQNIKVKDSNLLKSKKITASKIYPKKGYEDIEQWWLLRLWMLENYILRCDYIHGNDVDSKVWVWHPLQHLLLGAHIFPLTVKVLLANETRYKLNEEDNRKLHAIDNLLELAVYYDRRTNTNHWRKTIFEQRYKS